MTDKAPERIGLLSDGMGSYALATVDEIDECVALYIRADLAVKVKGESR